MEIIDKEKTVKWLSSKGLLLNSKGSLSFSGFSKPVSYRIPADSGRKTVLSRVITSLFDSETESLLWIDEWGIWPSCEDWTLFEGFRKSLGESAKLYEKPGHIFSKQDLGDITSLVAMVLYFCCGTVIVPATKSFIIRISHDEFIDIYSQDKEVLLQIKGIIEKGVDLDTL